MVWKGNAVTFRYMHSDWVVTCHFFRVLTVRSQLSYMSQKLSYPAMGGMVGW